jgi:outer membrane protein OmpA-like peptidoglycan-associated protein
MMASAPFGVKEKTTYMRRTFMTSSLVIVGLLATATPALADGLDLTLRVDPGVAIPLTRPQSDRFNVGGDLALKPTVGLLPWLDANVTLSAMALPSRRSGTDAGTAYGAGFGLRVKRPHDDSNTGSGWSAVSPWADTDLQMIGTGPLARPAVALAIGAAVPTSDARNIWLGPFVRYQQLVDSLDHTPSMDNTDARVLIVGLEVEFGPRHNKPTIVTPPVVEEQQAPAPIASLPAPTPVPVAVVTHLELTVQFPYDSAVPTSETLATLQSAAQQMASKDATVMPDKIELDGHASSEGQVDYNNKLSVRRGQAIADLLVQAGIPRDRLVVKGFGSRVPVASNKTEAGRIKNRRVEFKCDITITKQGGAK